MARPSTGAWSVYESLRIELSYLLKRSFIKKNCVLHFNLHWSDQRGNHSGSISCISSYLNHPEEQYIELIYTLTKQDGTKIPRRYKVYLYEQDSNLGKGKVLYFLCPQSGRKCRILYSAYGSNLFKARDSYRYRLYYDCQHASKLSKYNDTYWRIESHLKKFKKQADYGKRTYKDVPTKAAQRYNRLSYKQALMDELRWSAGVPKSLRRYMQNGRFPN